ncbi:MAG: hypothetical protein WCO42_03040 [bacterium]
MKNEPEPPSQPLGEQDWLWLALAGLCTLLVCIGANKILKPTRVSPPSTAPSPVVSDVSVTPPATVTELAPAPAWPALDTGRMATERTIPQYEAVRMTGEDLRRHSREDPHAADALSEAAIKKIEEEGALIK